MTPAFMGNEKSINTWSYLQKVTLRLLLLFVFLYIYIASILILLLSVLAGKLYNKKNIYISNFFTHSQSYKKIIFQLCSLHFALHFVIAIFYCFENIELLVAISGLRFVTCYVAASFFMCRQHKCQILYSFFPLKNIKIHPKIGQISIF